MAGIVMEFIDLVGEAEALKAKAVEAADFGERISALRGELDGVLEVSEARKLLDKIGRLEAEAVVERNQREQARSRAAEIWPKAWAMVGQVGDALEAAASAATDESKPALQDLLEAIVDPLIVEQAPPCTVAGYQLSQRTYGLLNIRHGVEPWQILHQFRDYINTSQDRRLLLESMAALARRFLEILPGVEQQQVRLLEACRAGLAALQR